MDETHTFLLNPGEWVGEGSVTLSISPEQLYFITKWVIRTSGRGILICNQEVRLEGSAEPVMNRFQIYDIEEKRFKIILENDTMGKIDGKGIIDQKKIAWEFGGPIEFQGYEIYHLEGEDLYKFHAEYASDDFRTIVNGHIRRTEEE